MGAGLGTFGPGQGPVPGLDMSFPLGRGRALGPDRLLSWAKVREKLQLGQEGKEGRWSGSNARWRTLWPGWPHS